MQKPLVVNKFLARRKVEDNNKILYNKLAYVRPSINTRCPESYTFFKNSFKRKSQVDPTGMEIDRRNLIIISKLKKIHQQPNNQFLKKSTRPFSQEGKNYKRKWDMLRIAQENMTMAKRLGELKSSYNTKKLKSEYQQKRYLMGNISEYPLIKYNLPKNKPVSQMKEEEKDSQRQSIQAEPYREEEDGSVVLYDKRSYILNFGVCQVKFFIKDQQLRSK